MFDRFRYLAILAAASASTAVAAPPSTGELSLTGTWVMASAYELKADGTRVTGYGEHPRGLMMVDDAGRYSIQIFRPDRPRFRSGNKSGAEPSEYRAAVTGSSTHFGKVSIDRRNRTLVFAIEAASFPNWEGTTQKREYKYSEGLLSYAVPASAAADGTIAHSVWRRVD